MRSKVCHRLPRIFALALSRSFEIGMLVSVAVAAATVAELGDGGNDKGRVVGGEGV